MSKNNVFKFALKSSAVSTNAEDFIIRMPSLGFVQNAMLYITDVAIKATSNASSNPGNFLYINRPGGAAASFHHTSVAICSTSFNSGDFDSRTSKGGVVLKTIPLQRESVFGANDGKTLRRMDVNYCNDTLKYGFPIKSFNFADSILNISIRDESLNLMTASGIKSFTINFIVVT